MGLQDASTNAVKEAGKALRGILAVYGEDQIAVVVKNKITEHQVNCNIFFTIEQWGMAP